MASALRACLSSPPLDDNENEKDAASKRVFDVLKLVKESQVESVIGELNVDESDILMQWVFCDDFY